MDTAMAVCGIAALAPALLVAVLLPNPNPNPERAEDGGDADVRAVAPPAVDGRQ
jgi:hypothetical protein